MRFSPPTGGETPPGKGILHLFDLESIGILFESKSIGNLRPQAPDAFGLNPPSPLLGYHWFAFLNQFLGFKNL